MRFPLHVFDAVGTIDDWRFCRLCFTLCTGLVVCNVVYPCGEAVTRSSTFRLIPFSAVPSDGRLVAGTISRDESCLYLSYVLSGGIPSLLIPRKAVVPSRCDGLWRSTCCECFFRVAGDAGYYELNVSPNGDWNFYHFHGYRTGMHEVQSVSRLLSTTRSEEHSFTLHCTVPLSSLAGCGDELEIGLSCVLFHKDGTAEYWALAHPDQKPDFHHPEAFKLRL